MFSVSMFSVSLISAYMFLYFFDFSLYFFLVSFFVFLFGLCIGSFLNVLIIRLPKEESVLGRSYCVRCKKKLKWYELIPLFSFLFLLGRCKTCKEKISWQYPLVEFFTGFLFVFTLYNLRAADCNLQNLLLFFCSLFAVSCLIVIFAVDLKYMIIPNKIVLGAVAVAFLYQIIIGLNLTDKNSQFFNFGSFGVAILSGILTFSFFLFLVVISKGKWMGMGDVKLSYFMGLLLSFPSILPALLIAFVSGSIIGIILIVFKKKNFQSKIPFGPFLSLGTIFAFFWSEELINWYVEKVLGF